MRGGISISTDKMTAATLFPTLHKRFDMVISSMPLQPIDPERCMAKNTWHVRVNNCPSRQVFVGIALSPETAIGSPNFPRVRTLDCVSWLLCVMCDMCVTAPR